jgi:hypothetical protein
MTTKPDRTADRFDRAVSLIVWLLALAAVLFCASLWTRASVAPMTREALAASFESDFRRVVLEWDPDDPRPAGERRRALFDFV